MEKSILITMSVDELESLIKNCLKEQLEAFIDDLKKPQEEDILMTTEETVAMLGVSKTTLHHWRKNGVLPYHRLNTRIYFRKSEIMEAMKVRLPKRRYY